MPSPRIYFVITLRGQLGPFDRNELRQALVAGEVQAGDQVRTALGKPLGQVGEVLKTSSDRIARRTGEHAALRSASSPSGWWSGPVPYLIIVLVGIVVALVMLRSGDEAVEPTPTLSGSAAPTTIGPVVRTSPQPSSVTPPADAPMAPTILQRLLPGRSETQWLVDGCQVREGDVPGSFRIGFPQRWAWAYIALDDEVRNCDRGTGLALDVLAGTPATRMRVEIIEPSGERFTAPFNLPAAGTRWVRVPWTSFTRRDWQPDGASTDGLQRTRITALTFWMEEEAARSVTFASVGIY